MSSLPPTIVFDIEASGLYNSFPTEIGWALPETDAAPVTRLIRPPDEWITDLAWDDSAEAMTGITREMLVAEGIPAEEVAREIIVEWGTRRALCDGLPLDLGWLRLILEWAPAGAKPAFGVSDFRQACLELDGPALWTIAVQDAHKFHPKRHRSGPDVEHLRAIWRMMAGLEPL